MLLHSAACSRAFADSSADLRTLANATEADLARSLQSVEGMAELACANERPGGVRATLADSAFTRVDRLSSELGRRIRDTQNEIEHSTSITRDALLARLEYEIDRTSNRLASLWARDRVSGGKYKAEIESEERHMKYLLARQRRLRDDQPTDELRAVSQSKTKQEMTRLKTLSASGVKADLLLERLRTCRDTAQGVVMKLAVVEESPPPALTAANDAAILPSQGQGAQSQGAKAPGPRGPASNALPSAMSAQDMANLLNSMANYSASQAPRAVPAADAPPPPVAAESAPADSVERLP